MSFSDLMQSGRGPGVIGMLLALVVLVGFGLLFMFAFDEGLQGGEQSIESVIAQQAKEIDAIAIGISSGEKKLAGAPALIARAKELTTLNRENKFRDGEIDSLTKAVATAKEAIEAKNQEIEGYKDEFRAFARGKAKGETMESLETRKGDIYQKVTIREVTPIGIQIMHDGGQKRIPFEELSAEIQDRFQFDPKQKAAAVAKEEAERNQHEADVSVATAAESQQMAAQREKEAEAKREQMIRALAVKKSRVETLKDEIEALEIAIPKEGLKRISKAPQMRAQLAGKQRDLSALEADIGRLQSSL
jgi:hypothetical protein